MKFKIGSLYAALAFAIAAPAAQADDLLQIYQQALTSDPIVLQAKAQRDALYETITGGVSLTQVIYDHSAWVG